jgi:hypothetical protein
MGLLYLYLYFLPLRHMGKVAYSSTHSHRQYSKGMGDQLHDSTALPPAIPGKARFRTLSAQPPHPKALVIIFEPSLWNKKLLS